MSIHNSSFTVFIRLPFPRKDFVDPPPVEWDAVKDKQLWEIISNASKVSGIDWNELAAEFQVPLPFLLQQVAWLYEKQMQQVQAQVRKARLSTGTATGPVNLGGQNLSTGLYQKKDATVDNASIENQKHGTCENPKKNSYQLEKRCLGPSTSRPSTTNTITTYQNAEPTTPSSGATLVQRLQRRSWNIEIPRFKTYAPGKDFSDSLSDSDMHLPASPRHRTLLYTSKLIGQKLTDEDDDDLAFLPYVSPTNEFQGETKSVATGNMRHNNDQVPSSITRGEEEQPQSSKMASVSPNNRGLLYNEVIRKYGSSNSSKLTSEIDIAISGAKKKFVEKTEVTPSVGSSFSDLDDSSITQSALEEALSSNMKAGAMASRMSTISQALRSKYL